jgi:hypothetical protein
MEVNAMSSPQLANPPLSQYKETVITCDSGFAEAVFLAGSFNDWSPTATPMKAKGGHWSVSLPLAPGHYEYKFVVDGQWCCEPGCTSETVNCARCVMNEFGTMNRVLEV